MGAADNAAVGDGLKSYYRGKIEELEMQCKDKQHNLRRLEAQRNELNMKGGRPVRAPRVCCCWARRTAY